VLLILAVHKIKVGYRFNIDNTISVQHSVVPNYCSYVCWLNEHSFYQCKHSNKVLKQIFTEKKEEKQDYFLYLSMLCSVVKSKKNFLFFVKPPQKNILFKNLFFSSRFYLCCAPISCAGKKEPNFHSFFLRIDEYTI
jgi:hypothetical protein